MAENFRKSVEELGIKHECCKALDVVTISVGYYVGRPADVSMATQLVDYADKALYSSKRLGGNVVSFV